MNCNAACLTRTFSSGNGEAYPILLPIHLSLSQHLTLLKQAFTRHYLSIILPAQLPQAMRYHTLWPMTEHYHFSNNYLPLLIQMHPSHTLEECSQYNTFTYEFYQKAQTQTLNTLCQLPLPTSIPALCVRKHLKDEHTKVPESWVRDCLAHGEEGLVIENGWVGVRKEYYWSGRVNRTGSIRLPSDL